jgi:hypothetical protein
VPQVPRRYESPRLPQVPQRISTGADIAGRKAVLQEQAKIKQRKAQEAKKKETEKGQIREQRQEEEQEQEEKER